MLHITNISGRCDFCPILVSWYWRFEFQKGSYSWRFYSMLISEQTWLTVETTMGRTCLFALVSFFYMCLYHLAEWVVVSEKVSAKELCSLVTLSMGPLFKKTLEADSQLVLSVVFMLYCFPTDLFEAIVNFIFILGCSLLLHRNTILSLPLLLNLLVLLVF